MHWRRVVGEGRGEREARGALLSIAWYWSGWYWHGIGRLVLTLRRHCTAHAAGKTQPAMPTQVSNSHLGGAVKVV